MRWEGRLGRKGKPDREQGGEGERELGRPGTDTEARDSGSGVVVGKQQGGEEVVRIVEGRKWEEAGLVLLELQERREARVVAGLGEEFVLEAGAARGEEKVSAAAGRGREEAGEREGRTSSSSAAVARERTSTQRQMARKLLRASLRLSGFLSDGVPLVAIR